MTRPSAAEKYLALYAEPETRYQHRFESTYNHSLVIPAYREEASRVRKVWRSLPSSTLVILVLNARQAPDIEAQDLFTTLTADRQKTQVDRGISLHCRDGEPDLLIVDRFSEGRTIPEKTGVGLARKIGHDIALKLSLDQVVISNWLFTTDADAILPQDYFDITPAATDTARVCPFRHEARDGLDIPVLLYEIYLLYYAAALRAAGSPYAYPTVGSTIACQVEAYASVRGYPKRATGEDFYLLNKLCKLGTVATPAMSPVILEGRLSTRVPVGTGQAVAAIDLLTDPLAQYGFEHPDCFRRLADLLTFISELSDRQPEQCLHPDPIIQRFCESSGLLSQYHNKKAQQPSPAVMLKFLTDWFDGLRTRQFIRFCRDDCFGTIPVSSLAESDLVSIPWQGISSLTAVRNRLSQLVYS